MYIILFLTSTEVNVVIWHLSALQTSPARSTTPAEHLNVHYLGADRSACVYCINFAEEISERR